MEPFYIGINMLISGIVMLVIGTGIKMLLSPDNFEDNEVIQVYVWPGVAPILFCAGVILILVGIFL